MNTQIIRPPKQSLETFGTTNVYYYLVAEATTNEIVKCDETVIREGPCHCRKAEDSHALLSFPGPGFQPRSEEIFRDVDDSLRPQFTGPILFLPQ